MQTLESKSFRIYYFWASWRSMKGHEHKLARMEDILNVPVQDPPRAEFSAAHIKWVKVEGGRQGGDDIALVPFARVGDFVKGESSSAASFRVEPRRKIAEGSISKPRVDGYLEYTLAIKMEVLACMGLLKLCSSVWLRSRLDVQWLCLSELPNSLRRWNKDSTVAYSDS